MKTRSLALVALLVGCGGATTHAHPAGDDEDAGVPETPQVTIALRFEEAPDDASGTPRTRVVLARIVRGEGTDTHEIVVAPGACSHAWPERGTLIHARCTWAEARDEIVVSRQGNEILARAASGTEVRVDIPAGAHLEVLQPATMPTAGTGTPPTIIVQPDAIRR